MRTWKIAHAPLRCGGCRAAIATGQPFLEYRVTAARTLIRCQACGESMTGESAPDTIEESAAPAPALAVRHQPSLGFPR